MDEAMRAAVQTLLDKDAIREIIYRYCHANDRRNWEMLKTLYHEDGTDDHGRFKGLASDFAEYAASRQSSELEITYHTVGSIAIELDGDSAKAESYMTCYHLFRSDDGGPLFDFMGARLVDRFERRQGTWAIADRVLVRDWRHRVRLEEPEGADEFVRGRVDEDDMAWGMFFAGRT